MPKAAGVPLELVRFQRRCPLRQCGACGLDGGGGVPHAGEAQGKGLRSACRLKLRVNVIYRPPNDQSPAQRAVSNLCVTLQANQHGPALAVRHMQLMCTALHSSHNHTPRVSSRLVRQPPPWHSALPGEFLTSPHSAPRPAPGRAQDDGSPYSDALAKGGTDMLDCLRRLGCSWGTDRLLAGAVRDEAPVENLKWLLEHGYAATERELLGALACFESNCGASAGRLAYRHAVRALLEKRLAAMRSRRYHQRIQGRGM